MKRILILAILLMMLAVPVIASPVLDPNGHSDLSVAYFEDGWAMFCIGDINRFGYSGIGQSVAKGCYIHGLSKGALYLHGPELPPHNFPFLMRTSTTSIRRSGGCEVLYSSGLRG